MVGTENQRRVQQGGTLRLPGLRQGASDRGVKCVDLRGNRRHEPEDACARVHDGIRMQIIGAQIISGSQRQRHLQTLHGWQVQSCHSLQVTR